MVLSKLPVPGRPANLDYSRARASALAVGAGGGCWGIFLSSIISLLPPSLLETARYRLKYCLKEPLDPNNQPTNQPTSFFNKTLSSDPLYGRLGDILLWRIEKS